MSESESVLPSRVEHRRDKYSDHTVQLRHEELIGVLDRIAEQLKYLEGAANEIGKTIGYAP